MTEQEMYMLSKKEVIPTDEYISSILGDKMILWQKILKHVSENYKDVTGSWNYYNDGKRWLFKLVQKKKTIFWAGILQDTFRISLWYSDKAEPLFESSDLPELLKNDFKTAKKYGAIRAVSVKVFEQQDAENVFKLIAIKQKLK
jgi:hypothetical protein